MMMQPPRRRWGMQLGRCALAAAALAAMPARLLAAPALRLLVGFPPGGGTDAIARQLAEALQPLLGRPVLVDNRAGAGGQLAAQALKQAAPDGNTLLLSHDHTVSILPLVLKDPGFDPARDFAPVAGFARFANALAVSTQTPAQSLEAYLAWVRADVPARGAVGVPAPASVPEFLVQSLAQRAALVLVAVPYRGSAPMVQDMMGAQIAAGVGSVPDFIETVRAGRLRVLAVMGSQRQAALPQVPTLTQAGIAGFEALPYYGLFAPAGTPAKEIARLSEALALVLQQAPLRSRLEALGLEVAHSPPAELAALERAYREDWARIIATRGFRQK